MGLPYRSSSSLPISRRKFPKVFFACNIKPSKLYKITQSDPGIFTSILTYSSRHPASSKDPRAHKRKHQRKQTTSTHPTSSSLFSPTSNVCPHRTSLGPSRQHPRPNSRTHPVRSGQKSHVRPDRPPQPLPEKSEVLEPLSIPYRPSTGTSQRDSRRQEWPN